MGEFTGYWLSAGGHRLACRASGVGDPVVLLHGLPFCSAVWRRVAPGLAERWRVVAPDLIGMGRSDKPLDFDYSLPNLVRVMGEALDALQLGPVTLVGQDLGGTIALALAAHSPERVSRLVVLNTTIETSFAFPWFHLLVTHPSNYAGVFRLASRGGLRSTLSHLVGNPALIDDNWLYEYGTCFTDPAAVWTLAKIMAAVVATPEEFLLDVREGLARLDRPAHVLWGERDEFLPVECGRHIQEYIPGATFEVVAGAGHLFFEERPEALIGLLTAVTGSDGHDPGQQA